VRREKSFGALSTQGGLTAPGWRTTSFSNWPEAGGLTALARVLTTSFPCKGYKYPRDPLVGVADSRVVEVLTCCFS
jgi:hypothetical protein